MLIFYYLWIFWGVHCVLQAGLKLCSPGGGQTQGNPPASAFQVLGLQVCTTTPGPAYFLKDIKLKIPLKKLFSWGNKVKQNKTDCSREKFQLIYLISSGLRAGSLPVFCNKGRSSPSLYVPPLPSAKPRNTHSWIINVLSFKNILPKPLGFILMK